MQKIRLKRFWRLLMSTKMSDEELAKLYQARKRRNPSPADIKDAMLAASQKPKQSPWWQFELGAYAQFASVFAALVVAIYVIGYQLIDKELSIANAPTSDIEIQDVQIHIMKTDLLPTNEKNRRLYDQAYKEYAGNKLHLDIHRQTVARVISQQHSDTNALKLLTCEDTLLSISKDVLALFLPAAPETTPRFKEGQMLALSFDDNGYIIGIEKDQNQKLQCADA